MKRKGFTLVELLGVIVVLAIIALIAVPTILGIIEKSRKGALQNSGYGLVEAGTLYNAQYQNEKTTRFDIKDNEITTDEETKLTYKGNIKEGTVLVNNNGEVTVCINDGKYAAYKNFKDNKVIVVEGRTCNIPENSNIVYLDNEATIDTSNQELLSRIEALENTVKEQKEEIDTLKSEKANENDITNSINNLTSTHNTDITLLNNRLGSTNISSIGNGTITGAISHLNSRMVRHISTTTTFQPWLAIKENFDQLPIGVSSGFITSGPDFGYIFHKTSDTHGSGIVFGYSTGWVWHVYRDTNFHYETISVSGHTTY